jgi:hypothetical protein
VEWPQTPEMTLKMMLAIRKSKVRVPACKVLATKGILIAGSKEEL